MRSHNLPLREDVFVWALGSLSRCHRRPFEPDLVLQQYPPPYNIGGFIRAAQALGFKTGLKQAKAETLHRLALPCGALMKPASESHQRVPAGSQFAPLFGQAHAEPLPATNLVGEQAPAPPAFGLALILKADAERVLFVEAGSTAPTVMSCAEFSERYAGQALQVSPKAQVLPEDLQTGEQKAPFGFAWFIPELLKYKAIWRDVLLASLVIQLMALATPLFTQVVIDKVVVHHTQSTLTVIGIALGMFMLFTAVMTWIRQYLVLHTGNRVDAVLGIQVFEHLFKLPTRYFEHRPTGVVVARLHAVEHIREFVSGAAVTLLLDCPFLLIFLGLMFYYSVPLSLVSLGILGLIVGLSFAVSPRLRKRL